MRRAEAIEDAIWLCPDLTTIFSVLAAADPAVRCELMVAAFREMSAFCFASYDAFVTVLLVESTPEQYTTFKSYTLAPGVSIGAGESRGGLVKSWGDAARVGVD